MKILSTSPTRISLFGGGTDLAVFSDKYGGICISMAINIRQEVIVGDKHKLLSSDNPDFFKTFIGDKKVKHKFKGETESGLGSSASLAVALTSSQIRESLDNRKKWIAEIAWDTEVNVLGLYGGKQDQYAAAFGGMNIFTFKEDGSVEIKPIDKEVASFWKDHILLFYTGIKRKDNKIQEQLKELSEKQISSLKVIKQAAIQAERAIKDKDFGPLAYLMQESWNNKKKTNPLMLTKELSHIYDIALKAGAWSGKLLGSGGGGYMIFLCEDDKRDNIIKKMEEINGVEHIPFDIDWEGVQTKVI